MGTDNFDDPHQIDFAKVPMTALRQPARALLSRSLNPTKILPSENGFPRDWRGIAHLAGLQSLYGPAIQTDADPMSTVLSLWRNEGDIKTATFDNLIKFLGVIDRWDVADDLTEFLVQDAEAYKVRNHQKQMIQTRNQDPRDSLTTNEIHEPDANILTHDDVLRSKQGLSPQIYDAFLLFADEDIEFAAQVVERLEEKHPRFSFKLCLKNRDLLGGIMFEHDAIMRLISERCNRLIVIVSEAFLKSPANAFFVNFAQALQIEQRRRKIIPCLYENCILPPSLSFYFHLKYHQSGRLFNFWDKLSDSIRRTNTLAVDAPHTISNTRIQISEILEPSGQTMPLQLQSNYAVPSEVTPIKVPRKKGSKLDIKKVHPAPEPIRGACSMIQLNAQTLNEITSDDALLRLNNCDMTNSESNLSAISTTKTSRNMSGWFKNLKSLGNGKTKSNPPAPMDTSTKSSGSKMKTKRKIWGKIKLTSNTV